MVQADTTVIFLLANPGHFTVERIPVSEGTKKKRLVNEIILQWQVDRCPQEIVAMSRV